MSTGLVGGVVTEKEAARARIREGRSEGMVVKWTQQETGRKGGSRREGVRPVCLDDRQWEPKGACRPDVGFNSCSTLDEASDFNPWTFISSCIKRK